MRLPLAVFLLAALAVGCTRDGGGAVATSTTLGAPATTTTRGAAGCEDFSASPPSTRAAEQTVVCVARVQDGPIAAVLEQEAASGPGPPPFVIELFARGPVGWELLADLSKIPRGAPIVGASGQVVETLASVDFDGDGTDSLVVGVLSVGASAGPLEVSVLSFRGVDVAVDLRVGTESGGSVQVEGREVILESGAYQPGEPRCCPSGIKRQRIGWDPGPGRVDVLETTVTPVSTTP